MLLLSSPPPLVQWAQDPVARLAAMTVFHGLNHKGHLLPNQRWPLPLWVSQVASSTGQPTVPSTTPPQGGQRRFCPPKGEGLCRTSHTKGAGTSITRTHPYFECGFGFDVGCELSACLIHNLFLKEEIILGERRQAGFYGIIAPTPSSRAAGLLMARWPLQTNR